MWKRLPDPPDPALVRRALELGEGGRGPRSIASALKVSATDLACLMARAGYAWEAGERPGDGGGAGPGPAGDLPVQYERRVLRLGRLGLPPEAIRRAGPLPAAVEPLVAPFLAARGLGPGDPKPELAEAHDLWLRALPMNRLADHLRVPGPDLEAAFAAHGYALALPPEMEAAARAMVASGATKRAAARALRVREALVYALPDLQAGGGGGGSARPAGDSAEGAGEAAVRLVAC